LIKYFAGCRSFGDRRNFDLTIKLGQAAPSARRAVSDWPRRGNGPGASAKKFFAAMLARVRAACAVADWILSV
jgi:hypothetical protein